MQLVTPPAISLNISTNPAAAVFSTVLLGRRLTIKTSCPAVAAAAKVTLFDAFAVAVLMTDTGVTLAVRLPAAAASQCSIT